MFSHSNEARQRCVLIAKEQILDLKTDIEGS